MKVSLITITHNKAEGLRRTIASINAQRLQPGVEVEHIIVDGCSSDGTDAVLKEVEAQSIIIRREPVGVYDAINAGISAASGSIIGLLHGGDVFSDNSVIQDVVNAFSAIEAPDYVYGDIHYLTRKGRIGRLFQGRPASRETLLTGFQPPHPSLYITAKAQREVGLYSTDYRNAGDYEMILRIFFNDNLRGRYLARDMVAMEPGGLATRLSSRLWINNAERRKALRSMGFSVSWFTILRHYLYLFRIK